MTTRFYEMQICKDLGEVDPRKFRSLPPALRGEWYAFYGVQAYLRELEQEND